MEPLPSDTITGGTTQRPPTKAASPVGSLRAIWVYQAQSGTGRTSNQIPYDPNQGTSPYRKKGPEAAVHLVEIVGALNFPAPRHVEWNMTPKDVDWPATGSGTGATRS